MGKAVSRGQALQISGRVAMQVDWDALDGDRLQGEVIDLTPEQFKERFTAFLKNGAQFIIGEPKVIRTKFFDPARFIGKDWRIWRGSANGDGLTGEKDTDPRSQDIAEIEIARILFETCLREGENSITGEEKLSRLKKAGHIRLGGNTFLGLWEDYQANKENSVLEWLYRSAKITYMDFFGDVLRSPGGRRRVLYLYRFDDGSWFWRVHWLGFDWVVDDSSAGLAS